MCISGKIFLMSKNTVLSSDRQTRNIEAVPKLYVREIFFLCVALGGSLPQMVAEAGCDAVPAGFGDRVWGG
jgi:hypothetical protein